MPATYPPARKVEIAFATDPLAVTPTWTDVTEYVRAVRTRRGRSHELGRIETGTATVELDDADRRFDPLNTSSPHSPNVLPLKKIRITLDDTVTQFPMFTGYVERWPMAWTAPGHEFDRAIHVVDGFEFLGIAKIVTARATLTTGAGNSSIKYQSRGAGVGGNGISIEYVILPDKATYHAHAYLASEVERLGTAETKRIIVVLGTTTPGGSSITDARHVMAAIRHNPSTDALVEVSLPGLSTGHDIVNAMERTYLTGGEYAQELSSTRVTNVLDDASWPTGASHRDIQTGQSQVAEAGWLDSDEQMALDHIFETTDAEGGVFFMDGSGKAVFHDRHWRWKAAQLASVATFGDSTGEIPYEALNANFDRDEVRNDARVSYEGAKDPVTYADTANQSTYGRRTVSQDLSLVVSHDAESRAQYLVEAFKSPKLRMDKIVVRPMADSTAWAALLTLEIGDRVTIKRRPPEHPAGGAVVITQDCFVESIEMTLGDQAADSAFTIGMTPVPWASFWLLGDSTYGVLDSTTRLGY